MANLYWGLRHLFVTVFLSTFAGAIVRPVITDVAVETVCQGKDECSLVIYLTGIQQAIAGVGSAVMLPLIGELSDTYGRKNLLTLSMTLAIIPTVILAWKRTTSFYYAYYTFQTLFATITDGGIASLTYSYLADNVPEAKRCALFPMLFGVGYAASICGNLAVGLLSTSLIFQVAAVISIVALFYMRVFLNAAALKHRTSERPLLSSPRTEIRSGPSHRKIKDFVEHVRLLSSTTFVFAALISFLDMVAEDGAGSNLLYFLKARFHFNKDQFALIFLIIYIGAAITNVLFMPILGPVIGESILLPFGLFCGFLSMLLDSIAWSPSVPYISASLGAFFCITTPCIRSIVSKEVAPNHQGVAQGCISGITSLAFVLSPLIFSPLSALFMSERAPFPFPGFSILCIGFSYLIGFTLSVLMKVIPLSSKNEKINGECIAEGLTV